MMIHYDPLLFWMFVYGDAMLTCILLCLAWREMRERQNEDRREERYEKRLQWIKK